MENNFDNFFKNKLEHRKFEMKPEFWEGAEALIEADEKSGNRRGFFVWFRFASFAGLSIFFVWGIVDRISSKFAAKCMTKVKMTI